MNKHLNNWFDKEEGLPEETTNTNIMKEVARQLGSRGGKKSVKSRFSGKTKKEISELMRKVRLSKSEKKELNVMAQEMVDNLNKNVTDETNLR